MTSSREASERYMDSASVRSLAPARAELAQMLVGKARIITELVTGAVPVAGDGRATQLNPQTLLGHDHSGPPWGPAFRQPIAVYPGIKPDSTNVQQRSPSSTSLQASGTTNVVVLGPWPIFVCPFDPLPSPSVAPWSRGYVALRAHRTAGSTSTDVVVSAWNLSIGEASADAITDTVTFGALANNETTALSDCYVRLRPGINVVKLSFACATAGHTMMIDSVELEQRAKLSH